ncbi:MAG TPA: hypothetical protein VM367_01965 [Pseudonocardia sp.]|nr:hypothetical protein [Pseudonocardia sp.]
MTGAGAGTGGDGGQRARPAWLVEEDPDAVWFGDLQYTDPVIGGDRSGGDRR